jgi:hypothetical protein
MKVTFVGKLLITGTPQVPSFCDRRVVERHYVLAVADYDYYLRLVQEKTFLTVFYLSFHVQYIFFQLDVKKCLCKDFSQH